MWQRDSNHVAKGTPEDVNHYLAVQDGELGLELLDPVEPRGPHKFFPHGSIKVLRDYPRRNVKQLWGRRARLGGQAESKVRRVVVGPVLGHREIVGQLVLLVSSPSRRVVGIQLQLSEPEGNRPRPNLLLPSPPPRLLQNACREFDYAPALDDISELHDFLLAWHISKAEPREDGGCGGFAC